MAGSDGFEKGEPLQIINITSKGSDGNIIHGLELNEENLEKILLHPVVKDLPVVIISITGAFRKGKSFLLGFFLKFLESQEFDLLKKDAKKKCDWLIGNDKIAGFEWRGGMERVTSGILIWSKPFICQDKLRRKVAVLLMDTQGIFDRQSTIKDSAGIVSLCSLISSVQIYNIMQQIQEDDLQNFMLSTEFGKLATRNFGNCNYNTPKLVFLIRDWGWPDEYHYGEDGGKKYVSKVLEETTEQPQELKNIRRAIKNCFPDVSGFLLPYPGRAVVTNKMFDGKVKEMDGEFVESVKLLVPHIISSEMLLTKQINGTELRGENYMMYIKAFVSSFNNKECPTPKTALEAFAAVRRQMGIKEVLTWYQGEMKKVFPKSIFKVLSEEDLENNHKRLRVCAKERLRKYPQINMFGHLFECEQQLEGHINQEYDALKKEMEKRNKFIKDLAIFTGAAVITGLLKYGSVAIGVKK